MGRKEGRQVNGLADVKKAWNETHASTPDQAPQPSKKGPSLRDRLLAQAKSASTVSQLQQTFRDADDAGATPEIVRDFAETVGAMDACARHKLTATKSAKEAAAEWMAMTWDEQEHFLDGLAQKGDVSAKEIMNRLASFTENIPLRDMLREVVDRFQRPLARAENFFHLKKVLDELVQTGLAICIKEPRIIGEHKVYLELDEGKFLYLPKNQIRIAKVGWQFALQAFERAKENQKLLNDLRAKATPGLTPEKVSKGEEGKLFLLLGPVQAVIIKCAKKGDTMRATVTEAIGLDVDLPAKPVDWDGRYDKSKGKQWCDFRIPGSLEVWEKSMERRREQRTEERARKSDELKTITSLATLPGEFEAGSLTHLLNDTRGTLAPYHRNFEWYHERGLFGVAIERTDEGFFLREVISDFEGFDRGLIGEKLPLATEAHPASISLEHLPEMAKERFTSLKMVEKLLKSRLRAEAERGPTS